MRKRFEFIALYGLTWIALFQLFRFIFLFYHYKKTFELSGAMWARIAWYGLRMDISSAGYILLLPTLLIAFTGNKWKWYDRFIAGYSLLTALLIVILTVADLELFRAWGFRMDGTSLIYLKTPKEALASAGAAPLLTLVCLFALLFAAVAYSLKIVREGTLRFFEKSPAWYTMVLYIVLAAALIIPIRGGLQLAPMNESAVFFSDKSFANHAAVNLSWNFMNSIIKSSYSKKNPFIYQDQKAAETNVAALYKPSGEIIQMIANEKPVNVLIIIWESFTAKVVEGLNGTKGVTPQFEALTKEGILFTNMYASGNRSDKGMVAILSGYPAQPTASIIKIPNKTRSLPSLPKTIHKNGYYTSFYYGGETEFANMKSYFLQQGFDKIIDKNAFASADMNSKWGAHDHVVLNRLAGDLDQQQQPFFTTLFTLSSHEPFEVPVPTAINGTDVQHLFLNAHHYTDASIGDFIRKAKTKAWWNNTLIIILADHGHPLPELSQGKPGEFHMPMLWLGGVLKEKNVKIDTLCSQTDVAATLLGQLHLPSSSFAWSNDIFKKNRISFAYFAFNNGLGWMKPDGFIVRDNLGGNIIEQKGNLRSSETELGKAYLQSSFNDYLKR